MFNDLSSGCNQIHLSCQFPMATKHEGAFLININTLIGNGYCVDLYPSLKIKYICFMIMGG